MTESPTLSPHSFIFQRAQQLTTEIAELEKFVVIRKTEMEVLAKASELFPPDRIELPENPEAN